MDPTDETDQQRLAALIAARHPCVSVVTYEEQHALTVVREAAVEQGTDCLLWSAGTGLRDGLLAGAKPIPDTEHPAAALYHVAHAEPRKGVYVFLDLAGHLDDERTLRMLRDAIAGMGDGCCTLVMIDHSSDLPPVIAATATRLELSFPDLAELERIVRATLRDANEQRRISVSISRAELDVILRNLRGLTRRQARQVVLEAVSEDRKFDADDLRHVMRVKRRAVGQTGLLEFVEAPISMDQIGGLSRLKQWLDQRSGGFGDEAEKFGLAPPRGLLLLGVQGAGKSLAAKAVATAWHRPLLRMDVGALYDRWVGESERRLRDALRQAEMTAPAVLWIDEIEKAFASASSSSNDGGLSRRMFGALLTWMQEHRASVFLIATANDIGALPPELLRKGRFDEIFFVDLPGEPARRAIFEIHLKRRNRRPKQFDLNALVAASEGFSGAEIEQAILSGLYEAFADGKRELATADVLAALAESPPLSVTRAEQVAELRRWAAGRCVAAG